MHALQDDDYQVAKKLNLGIWLKVLKYTFKLWPLLLILLFTMLITSFYDSSFTPLMMKGIWTSLGKPITVSNIADFVIEVNIWGLDLNLKYFSFMGVLLGGTLIRSISIFITFFVGNYLELMIITNLRKDSFKRVQELSFSYFDKTPTGWLISRMQNDASTIGELLSWGLLRVIWSTFDLMFTFITMFMVSWQLSLVILATTPLIIIIAPLFEVRILKSSRNARAAYSDYIRWLAECIDGSKTIKSLAIEDTISKEADEITLDVKKKYYRTHKIASLFQPSVQVISSIAMGLIIILPIYVPFFQTTALNFSVIILFIGFVNSIYNPIQDFADLFAEFIGTQANVEKILSLIETMPQIVDSKEVIEKYGTLFNENKDAYETLNGEIEFKNVSFEYVNDVEVIHNLNLKIKQGQSVAIVGETGSGKSTTANLLCRFYEPTSGEILIDGVDYRKRSLGWLRSNLGYVQQNPFVFSGTIKDNIRYGKLDATDEEIKKAAMLVDLDSFIMSLKDGYNTILEDGGNQLSVGQKQLISFARAVLRNPRIMILDEATSSIDTETEATIQSAMDIVLKNRTSLIIAHRLSTIINADRILVMVDGIIKEDGSHKELMLKKGYYHRLYMNQFAELNLDEQMKTFEVQIEGYKLDGKI